MIRLDKPFLTVLLALVATAVAAPALAGPSGAGGPTYGPDPGGAPREEVHRHRARSHPRKRVVVIWPRVWVRSGVTYYHRVEDDGRRVEVEVPKVYVRARRASLGVGIGAMVGLQPDRSGYVDPGVLASLRYRLAEPVGAELRVGLYSDLDPDQVRLHVPVQGSVTVHTPSFVPVGLYGAFGLTADVFHHDPGSWTGTTITGVAVGPHAGGGLRFTFSPRAELELDARWTWLLTPTGWTDGGASPFTFGTTAAFHWTF